jgi:hypothetical protein
LRITDFSQSAPAANGHVTGSIAVEFTVNGCYPGASASFFARLFCVILCFISRRLFIRHRN